MTTPVLAHGVAVSSTRWPRASPLWLVTVLAGVVACASVLIARGSDHLGEPVLQVALLNWTVLSYLVAGAIATSRRPESRFGPLMMAAGCAMFLSSLQWSNAALPFTVGMVFDLVPAALLLHLFLAFPSGRLELRPERLLVGAAYGAALALQ